MNKKTFIRQIVNKSLNSNTFVVLNSVRKVVAIVDPGEAEAKFLLKLLANQRINQFNVILTHEHCDHIVGLIRLCASVTINIFLSEKCNSNLNNPKKNLSEYLDSGRIHNISPSSIYIVKDEEDVQMSGFNFKFYLTPGHSEGGICLGLNDIIFTGDTVLQHKITAKLPGGSKSELSKSVKRLSSILPNYRTIYPGHGNPYYVNEC